VTLDEKDPEEIITLSFDFEDDLNGETISVGTPVFTIAVSEGVDPDVGQMPNGAPQIAGALVLQSVKQGVAPVNYKTRCRIDTSGGRRLVLGAILPVRAK
jgi:hypothetical protein